jgi:hypothetical protein
MAPRSGHGESHRGHGEGELAGCPLLQFQLLAANQLVTG